MRHLSERLSEVSNEIIKDYEMVSKERQIYLRALLDLNDMRLETPSDFHVAKSIIRKALAHEWQR